MFLPEFFIDIILPAVLWPGVDSASNRNEYQEYFLVSKGGQCVGLTTLPHCCADCLEIRERQPPETLTAAPGLQWDCFTFTFTSQYHSSNAYIIYPTRTVGFYLVNPQPSCFGGLEVACWPLVPKFTGLHPAEAVEFLGQKNPQHAFLRRENKAVGPVS